MYFQQNGHERPETLFPFACGASYHDPNYKKFESRQLPAVALGYGPHNSIVVLDWNTWKADGTAKFVTTPDVQLHPESFPFKDDNDERPDLTKLTEAFTEHYANRVRAQGEVYDKRGRLICVICNKLKMRTEIPCKHCKLSTKHPKGRPGPGCLRARCLGHGILGDQGDPTPVELADEEKDDDEAAPAANVKHYRLRGKQSPRAYRRTVTVGPSGEIEIAVEPASDGVPDDVTMDVAPGGPPAPPPPTVTSLLTPGMPLMGIAQGPTAKTRKSKLRKLGRVLKIEHRPEDIAAMCGTREEIYERLLELRRTVTTEEERFLRSAREACAYVTRVASIRSKEAQENVEAVEAVANEMKQLVEELRTFDYAKVRSRKVVAAEQPDATFITGFMPLGEQHAEPSKDQRRFKARFVGGGHNIIDALGEKIIERLNQMTPASLDYFRVACTHALACKTGVVLKGDVRGAYLKSDMIGTTMWLPLPRELWPEAWKHLPYDDPAMPLEGALYGVSRLGYAWGWRARRELVARGYKWIRGVGEDSLYFRPSRTPGEMPTFVIL